MASSNSSLIAKSCACAYIAFLAGIFSWYADSIMNLLWIQLSAVFLACILHQSNSHILWQLYACGRWQFGHHTSVDWDLSESSELLAMKESNPSPDTWHCTVLRARNPPCLPKCSFVCYVWKAVQKPGSKRLKQCHWRWQRVSPLGPIFLHPPLPFLDTSWT
jgi:hypothetical protein